MASNINEILNDTDGDRELEEMRSAEAELPLAEEPSPADAPDASPGAEMPSPEGAGEEAAKEPTMVPYGVLREERDKRQALEERISTQTEQIGKMEQAFQQLLQKAQATMTPEEVPDFDLDPDAYNRHKLEQIEQKLQQTEQMTAQERQAQQREAQAQQFLNMYADAAQSFARERPDAPDAYQYALNAMDEELRLRGVVDPGERKKLLEYEEEQIVLRAFRQGANPAERIYELAQHRGYKKTETEEDKLDKIARTQEATSPVANAGGSDANPPITLARLAELDGEEFDKGFEKARKAGLLA